MMRRRNVTCGRSLYDVDVDVEMSEWKSFWGMEYGMEIR